MWMRDTRTITLALALIGAAGLAAAQPAPTSGTAPGPVHAAAQSAAPEQRWGVSAGQPAFPWTNPRPNSGPRIPQGRSVHRDYLLCMAPPEFRASTMVMASSLSADPGKGLIRIKHAMRERKARKLNGEVERELLRVGAPDGAK